MKESLLDDACFKYNFLFQHLLVGLTEDINSFVEMLELMLPQFFKGANELFHNADKDLNHVRKTKHKDPVSIF